MDLGRAVRDRRRYAPLAIALGLVVVLVVVATGAVAAVAGGGAPAANGGLTGLAASAAGFGTPAGSASGGGIGSAEAQLLAAQPTQRQALCESFVADVASRLGVSTTALQQALIGSLSDQVAQLQKDGKLSADAAAYIKGRLSAVNGPICQALPAFGRTRLGALARLGALGRVVQPAAVLDAAATALHETPQQLLTELGALQKGQNLETIAQKHGVSYATLESAITTSVRTQLDAAVKAGTITQARENGILSALQKRLANGGRGIGIGIGMRAATPKAAANRPGSVSLPTQPAPASTAPTSGS